MNSRNLLFQQFLVEMHDRKKKTCTVQIKQFEIVSSLALILAVLALVLVFIQYTSSLNQNQQSVSQEQLQALKVQLTDNIMAIQAQMNKSNAEVWTRYEQTENFTQALKALETYHSQQITNLQFQQNNPSHRIEPEREESVKFTSNELSTLKNNVSFLASTL